LTLVLLVTVPLSLLAALAIGSVPFGAREIVRALTHADADTAAVVIRELRLPRAANAFAVGGLLALAGALLQVLLRNPLADPYVLGVSGGAATAVLLGLLVGVSGAGVPVLAFAGALSSLLLVFGLSRSGASWTQDRLLLTGVVVAAGWGAMVSLLLSIAPSASLPGMLYWLLGDLGDAPHPTAALAVLVLGLSAAGWHARALNVLSQGETLAAALGERPARLRVLIYFLASLLTAVAVTSAGSIGFVGLIVPHLTRLLAGADHRWMLPNAVLLGGSFLVVADTAARTVVAPLQLPVGVITTLLGVPVFLYLLRRTHRP
jgi:iron complex transport system permease protein